MILAVCLGAWLAVDPEDPGPPTQLEQAASYWRQRAYLEADPEILTQVLRSIAPEQRDGAIRSIRYAGLENEPLDRERIAAEQAELDRLTEAAFAEIASGVPLHDRNAYTRWGLVAVAPNALSFATYGFLHAGWLHLVVTLFFLLLVGPVIEERWGGSLFAVFYGLASAASAGLFLCVMPDSPHPLIGASGAVAGLMGAFLVCCWRERIRLLPGAARRTPAWLVLPLWFAGALLMLWGAEPAAVGDGIAYFADVGGFAFGIAFALGLRLTGLEARFVPASLQAPGEASGPSLIARAVEAQEKGQLQRAFGILDGALRAHPDDLGVALAYWETSLASNRTEQALPVLTARIRELLAAGKAADAARLWQAVSRAEPDAPCQPALLVRLAPALLELGDREQATHALRCAVDAEDARLTPGQAFRIVDLARSLDPQIALHAAQLVLSDPELPDGRRDRMEALIATLEVVSGSGPERGEYADPLEPDAVDLDPDVAPAAPEGFEVSYDPDALELDSDREPEDALPSSEALEGLTASADAGPRFGKVKVIEATPVELAAGGVALALGDGKRVTLSYQKIDALAVATVSGLAAKPVLVLDLVGNWSSDGSEPLKLVRLRSDCFDPRDLVPAASRPADALRQLLDRLLAESGAVPLPDRASATGRPFRAFDDLATYQREVLQVSP